MKPKTFIKKVENHIFNDLRRIGVFDKMSDEAFIQMCWRRRMHYPLDLNNPQTFNEKLQWLKLYDRKPEYTQMVDKYEVKQYVAEKIGEQYIIPTLGVWDRFEDIDFDALPDQFVLKCTHDSGGLVIVRDKAKFDKEAARKKINRCLGRNYYWSTREWPYKNVKPRILAEQYLPSPRNEGLTDYKFYCFHGIPKFLYLSKGLENHATAQISFLDLQWNRMGFVRSDYAPYEDLPSVPKQFEHMVELAKVLSNGITFLRVDMYEINDQIYFSELTFTPCGGMMPFEPKEWDLKIGELIKLR